MDYIKSDSVLISLTSNQDAIPITVPLLSTNGAPFKLENEQINQSH